MGFANGQGTAGATAVVLMAPKAAGSITLYNSGPSAVTVGGPTVAYGNGLIITPLSLPVAVQCTHFGNVEDVDDQLYVIATNQATASATVNWIHGF